MPSFQRANPVRELRGDTDIDGSEQDESAAWFTVLTLVPKSDILLGRVRLDLDKATTGFATVETTATIQFRVARQIDGTNQRGAESTSSLFDQISVAVAGDNADGEYIALNIGPIGKDETVLIQALMSANTTNDIEIPYLVEVEAKAEPTITAVAAA